METKKKVKEKESSLKELSGKNFSVWNDALLSKDPGKVAALYTDDAIFLPTLNSELKIGKKGAEEYFTHFLQKNPEGKIIEEKIKETSIDKNGETNGFLSAGMYDFEVGEPGKRETVAGRFTFLWRKDENGKWEIQHHHSSLKPID
jgi:uncharacterized protein (TIGR02246 family)